MLAGPAADPTPPGRGVRRWLVPAVAAWAVVLVALAFVSALRDDPTVREQRALDHAAIRMHAATGHLLAAAGPGVVAEIVPERLVAGCRISVLRRGGSGRTDIRLYPRAGEAPAVLDRVAAGLPAGYRARVFRDDDGAAPVLEADAGDFVGVRGRVAQDGVVTLSVATGCRPVPRWFPLDSPPRRVPPHPEQQRVLAAVGGPRVEFAEAAPAVSCPGGGMAQTRVLTVGATPTDPAVALKRLVPSATAVRTGPDVYAYLADDTSVVVEIVDGGVRVAATMTCGA